MFKNGKNLGGQEHSQSKEGKGMDKSGYGRNFKE
jgi:hypothetical protein